MSITKKTVAIIGAETNAGSAIAKNICTGNYRLLLISNNPASVQLLASEINKDTPTAEVEVMDCQYDACWEADIIIMAVPRDTYGKVVEIIEEVATQKVVVSFRNLNDDLSDNLKSQKAHDLQELLSNSKIVEVQTDIIQAIRTKKRNDVVITSGSTKALKMTAELFKTAGLNPVLSEAPPVHRTSS